MSRFSRTSSTATMSENDWSLVRWCRIVRCGFGTTRLAACTARARPALRRAILHRRRDDRDLLPPDLSRAQPARAERAVLRDGGWRGSRGLPSVPSLPSRGRAGHPSVAGHVGNRLSWLAPDRRAWSRRPPRGNTRCQTRHRAETLAPSVYRAHWRVPARSARDAPLTPREATARRYVPALCCGRFGRRVRQRETVQRGHQKNLAADADGHPPTVHFRQTAGVLPPALVPASLRLGRDAAVSRRARDRRCRGRGWRHLRACVRSVGYDGDVRSASRSRAPGLRCPRVVGRCASALPCAGARDTRTRSGRGSRCHRKGVRPRSAPGWQCQASPGSPSAGGMGWIRNCRARHRRAAGIGSRRANAAGPDG